MSIFSTLLGKVGGSLVSDIGTIIDKTSTSDAEREQLKIDATVAVNNFTLALGEQLLTAEIQLTERQKNDMASDSWLSKNVRPTVLLFLTVAVMALAYLSIFTLDVSKVALINPWIDLLTTILLAAYSFYFGGRTIEKFQTIRSR